MPVPISERSDRRIFLFCDQRRCYFATLADGSGFSLSCPNDVIHLYTLKWLCQKQRRKIRRKGDHWWLKGRNLWAIRQLRCYWVFAVFPFPFYLPLFLQLAVNRTLPRLTALHVVGKRHLRWNLRKTSELAFRTSNRNFNQFKQVYRYYLVVGASPWSFDRWDGLWMGRGGGVRWFKTTYSQILTRWRILLTLFWKH